MRDEYNDEDLAIGIDLGTTNSCLAVLRNNKVEIIPNELGENLTPSIVSFTDEGQLVGEDTFNQLIINPKNTIYSIKRIIGRTFTEIKDDINSYFWNYDIIKIENEDEPKIKIITKGNNIDYYTPEQISSIILKKLLKSANEYLGKPVSKAVITVPAYFNDSQRQATKNAAILANIDVLNVINEPTAASLAYGLNKRIPKKENNEIDLFTDPYERQSNEKNNNNINIINENNNQKLILVFDLGGGTFDVTLLKIIDGEDFNILSTSGDSHLGGDDFNKKIMDFCLKYFCTKFDFKENEINKDSIAINRLKIASENAKICLSYEDETSITLEDFYKNETLYIKSFSKKKFEEICSDLFNKLIPPIEKVLEDAHKGPTDVNEIILVGGSTRMPQIKEIIHNYFIGVKVNINNYINPDETVAYGASILAAKLMKQGTDILNDIVLLDITPFSIGIEVHNNSVIPEIKNEGNFMSFIIPKGKKIPYCNTVKNYRTVEDFQKRGRISIYEGENKYVKYNHFLGEFIINDLPLKKRGEVKIEVTISIDINGILYVKAYETSKGVSNAINIINNKGILEKDVKKKFDFIIMTKDSEFIKSYRKNLNHYYKNYKDALNESYKYSYMKNFACSLVDYINTFDKEGNDTLGNKYFIYIRILFESYKILLQFDEKLILEKDVEEMKNNCKNFLNILIKFKNINNINYTKLIQFFLLQPRKDVLFTLVIYLMEIFEKKAESLLLQKNSKFSRYNSKYLFNYCLELSEIFIPFKNELDLFPLDKINHDRCLEKCKVNLNKINVESQINFEDLKENKKFKNFLQKKNREEILLILDNCTESLKSFRLLKNYSSAALCLAFIIKVKYKYLKTKDYELLKKQVKECIDLTRQNINNYRELNWYNEISDIDKELVSKLKEINYKKNDKNWEDISKEINEYSKKSNLEFINYILNKFPPKKRINENNKINEQQWLNDKDYLLNKLKGAYSPSNFYYQKTEEDKLNYKIYNSIFIELNNIGDK